MTKGKYAFKRSSTLQTTTYIVFAVGITILLIIWLVMRNLNSELAIVTDIFLPVLIVFGIIGLLLQIFVISKLYYVKLTDKEIIVYRVFPKTFQYSEIKRISFSDDMFKGIDTGMYMSWPILLNIENSKEFIRELSQKYKQSTGKNLVVQENF